MKHWWVPWNTILPGTSQDSFQLGWNGYSTRTKRRGIAYMSQGRSNMVQPVPLSSQSRMAKLVVQSFFVGYNWYNLVWPLPRKATKKGTIALKVKKKFLHTTSCPAIAGRLRCRELKNWLISASSSWIPARDFQRYCIPQCLREIGAFLTHPRSGDSLINWA